MQILVNVCRYGEQPGTVTLPPIARRVIDDAQLAKALLDFLLTLALAQYLLHIGTKVRSRLRFTIGEVVDRMPQVRVVVGPIFVKVGTQKEL